MFQLKLVAGSIGAFYTPARCPPPAISASQSGGPPDIQRQAPCFQRNIMTENVRRELDAIEVLMQDHRAVESLFSEFEHLQNNHKDTGRVIAEACANLRIHGKLATEIFYPAVGAATDGGEINGSLDRSEKEHDRILDLVEQLRQAPADQRAALFTTIAERVKRHVTAEETELFPLTRRLTRLDLESVAAAMKKRNAELIAEMEIGQTDEATV
jgi:hypothetical protein